MNILKKINSVIIAFVLIFSSCSSSETNETSSVSSPEEQVDTISLSDQIKSSEKTAQTKKETTKKTEPNKVNNYRFINADKGVPVSDDFKGDLMTTAAAEVSLEKKDKCGNNDCGKKIILVNMNPDKSIEVSVEIIWKENEIKIKKKRSYKLKESQKLAVGCSSMCDTEMTKIKWNIIGAVYSN